MGREWWRISFNFSKPEVSLWIFSVLCDFQIQGSKEWACAPLSLSSCIVNASYIGEEKSLDKR